MNRLPETEMERRQVNYWLRKADDYERQAKTHALRHDRDAEADCLRAALACVQHIFQLLKLREVQNEPSA